MPLVSQAQSRLMHWADSHPVAAARRGLKQSVVRDYISASHGQKVRDLPERTPAHKAKGGAVYPPPFRW